MALVNKALAQLAPEAQQNSEEGAPSSQTLTNDDPGLVVGAHAYHPPAVGKPIRKETPCLVCGQGPLAPVHVDRSRWLVALTANGGAVTARYA